MNRPESAFFLVAQRRSAGRRLWLRSRRRSAATWGRLWPRGDYAPSPVDFGRRCTKQPRRSCATMPSSTAATGVPRPSWSAPVSPQPGAQIYVLPAAALPALNAPPRRTVHGALPARRFVPLHDLAFPDSPEMIDPSSTARTAAVASSFLATASAAWAMSLRRLTTTARGLHRPPGRRRVGAQPGYGRRLLLTAHWLIEEKACPRSG